MTRLGASLSGSSLDGYRSSLDAGAPDKEGAIAPFIPATTRGEILDIGTGTGALAFRLAARFPHARVIGVDADRRMLEEARSRRPAGSHLDFVWGSALRPHSERAVAIVLCSVLHEVYSYHGDSAAQVARALRAAHESLAPGGRVVIRDFARPLDARRGVLLCHRLDDIVEGHDFRAFAEQFGRPVALDRSFRDSEKAYYQTDLGSAYEFIARKDFHETWSRELGERYGFWNQTEAKALVRGAGFHVARCQVRQDRWVLEHSLRGKVRLLSPETGEPLLFPARHLLIVGVKR